MSESGFCLVRDGRPMATIIVAPPMHAELDAAVRDMVRVVAEMSGAYLPVVEDAGLGVSGARVHLGPTEAAEKL